ncbi:MAG: TrkA C-terminal domain-containing protein, partial [Gemmatimonadales bacterium]
AEFRLDTLAHLGVHRAVDIIEIEPGARAIGSHPVQLRLRGETGATVIAVVRAGEVFYTPDPEYRFAAGDTVLIIGDQDAQSKARSYFVAPSTA